MLKITKQLGVLGIVIVTAIVGLVFAQGVVFSADTEVDITVPSTATGVPIIECKWELPDMTEDPAVFDYGPPSDDDPYDPVGVDPNDPSNMGPPPCSIWGPDEPPLQADGIHHMIQVAPWDHKLIDAAGNFDPLAVGVIPQRTIQLWGAVDHSTKGPNFISDVYWEVFHPDGVKKTQKHGFRVARFDYTTGDPCPWEGDVEMGQFCDYYDPDLFCGNLGTASVPGTMFGATYDTGQASSEAIDEMIHLCQQDQKGIWYAEFDLDKEQPCGEYLVKMTAVDGDSQTTVLTNYIDVLCTYYLEIDFDNVGIDWGELEAGHWKTKAGDADMSTPDFPSLHNGGNAGMDVWVEFDAMVDVANPDNAKTIGKFDAGIGRTSAELAVIWDIGASVPTELSVDNDHVMCANDIFKLELSVHPRDGLPAGTYEGNVYLTGELDQDCACSFPYLPLSSGDLSNGSQVEYGGPDYVCFPDSP